MLSGSEALDGRALDGQPGAVALEVGGEAGDAVKAAVMVEDVARTVFFARQLGGPQPIEPSAIDSLFNRYQNVYGQDPTGSLA